MILSSWIPLLGYITVFSPIIFLLVVGFQLLIGRPMSEFALGRWLKSAIILSLFATLAILAIMLVTGSRREIVDMGNMVAIDRVHFHFHISLIFDRLSVPMAILSLVLCGTVGAFALSYLHRDAGFQRFFLSFAMFLVGMVMASLAGTIETLFLGWELVGLSSALLVAYYQERPTPVANGLRVWAIYRLADAAFLAAAVALHHQHSEGNFSVLMGNEAWPAGKASLSEGTALLVGTFLLIAAAGKSGLVPFSGWLPRAMEGPTPSSAIFYGALSVHLGVFLLLRVSPILDQSALLSSMVIILGLVSAILAAIAGRVQTDVKSALAFASLTQVSIIVVEIGFGLRYLALIHIIGHACMRSLQLLRAPTLMRDYKTMENAIGKSLDHGSPWIIGWLSRSTQLRLYRCAIERGYLDSMLDACIVRPFIRLFSMFNRWERAWTQWLSGSHKVIPIAVEDASHE
ncbi:MAG: proton-conducting transporter membrane subunit [Pirellulaceae bacterium]|nr:proton-conducting transporter membrane subunit [Pirellulaceae bacterium]